MKPVVMFFLVVGFPLTMIALRSLYCHFALIGH